MAVIEIVPQMPTDFTIACDPAVLKDERKAAWIRYEDGKWISAVVDLGLRPKHLDTFDLRRIESRLLALGVPGPYRG